MEQVNPSSSAREQLLRLPEVCAQVGLKKSAIYAGVKAKTFPAPIVLGARAVAWSSSSIQAWIADRIKQSRRA
jgi:prophage regulatory protein